jgi:hypothetical protein
MVEHHREFAPREWVMEYMSCERATRILSDAIRTKAMQLGEVWTEGLAVKVNHLHDMAYWNVSDHERFQADYTYLRSMLRMK